MDWITTLDDLHAHYGTPSAPAVVKVTPHLTPSYRAFLDRSRFCVLTTVGPEGTDGSPRGDQGPVVSVIDPQTLALPDWKGNERIDSLRNIVRDGRVSLMFLVPGSTNALRVNGTARLTADPDLCQLHPRRQTPPHRHRHPDCRGLSPMRPRHPAQRSVDQRRPVAGPALDRHHARRGVRRQHRRLAI